MNTGCWTWWRDGDRTVVGWMPVDQFASDEPICTVKDARDAGLLVDVLTDIEAEPIS